METDYSGHVGLMKTGSGSRGKRSPPPPFLDIEEGTQYERAFAIWFCERSGFVSGLTFVSDLHRGLGAGCLSHLLAAPLLPACCLFSPHT
jgi:hypothetical protein